MNSSPSPTRSSSTSPVTPRLPYLDGLRGLLCLVVVIHHYQCGFDPCRVFGPSAEWIADPAICEDNYYYYSDSTARQLWQILVAPFANGPFAVATFFVMSGCALSLSLMPRHNYGDDVDNDQTTHPSTDDRWRLAVVKRFFRLALPCGAAMIFAYLLGWNADNSIDRSLRFHERAAIATQSRWLYDFGTRRPPSIVGLVPHTLLGIWHGSSMLNNAIWTMKFELMGSYLVFLLMAVLRGVPSARRRQQILIVLGMALLLPSPSVSNSVEVHIEFESKVDAAINGTATINPGTHFHLLESLKASGKLDNMVYERQELEGWYLIDQPNEATDRKILTIDIGEEVEEEEDEMKPLAIDSPDLLKLVGGSMASKLMHSDDILIHSSKVVKRSKWSSSKPYAWYASFVAGVFLADRVSLIGSSPLLKVTPMGAHKYVPLYALTYLCASYPLKQGGLVADQNIIWSTMGAISGFFGLDASLFYHTLGATMLVWILTFQSRRGRIILASGPLLYVGKISFALYLTHIPILYSLTSALYVWLKGGKQWGNSAGGLAFGLSVPVLLLAAAIFEKYVDRPSIQKSNAIGKAILGVKPSRSSSFSGREGV